MPLRCLFFSSGIRESMVKIMLAPDPRQQSPFGEDHGDDWQLDGIAGRGAPMGPSTCIFWGAVALGALVRGSPLQSVSRMFLNVRTTTRMESYHWRNSVVYLSASLLYGER